MSSLNQIIEQQKKVRCGFNITLVVLFVLAAMVAFSKGMVWSIEGMIVDMTFLATYIVKQITLNRLARKEYDMRQKLKGE